ncbi:MAG: circularly permuted type 2 ATP-grasp protein [Acidimicrobiales bacterium]
MAQSGPLADYQPGQYFDEVVDTVGSVRDEYRAVSHRLAMLGTDELVRRQQLKDRLFRTRDITFTVYGESAGTERTFPLDLFPRVISAGEWAHIERGLVQRLRALNQFLGDLYDGDAAIVNDGIVPRDLIEAADGYADMAFGIPQPFNARALVAGIDLVRDEDGSYLVLEDNLRVPSGVSYVLENRLAMTRLMPKVLADANIRTVEQYPTLLLRALQSIAPPEAGSHPVVALLTPGVFNSAYFEHSFLAENMGVQLVEGRDLFVDDGAVWMRTTRGRTKVDVIYRRVDDQFLDPEAGRSDSMLGVPGLVSVARAGGVTLANALGNGAADDKAMYTFVPDMIRYYLNEDPVLPNVETHLLGDPDIRRSVLDDPTRYVIKPVDGSGGYGIFIGPQANDAEVAEVVAAVEAEPRRYIAQRVVRLSRHPTLIDGRLEPRHVDLRPFVVGGEYIDVLPGGLTRVALREGSLIVNSSQGGGSKDTWVERSNGAEHGITRPMDRRGRVETDAILARVAEPLFWTGRYLERMDGTARLLAEAHHGVLAGLPVEAGLRWTELLEVLTLTGEFAETGFELGAYPVTRFLVDDRDNQGSIIESLSAARSNLRSVRERVPVELRSAVNDAWTELAAVDFDRELREHPQDLFTRTTRDFQLFLGVTESAMARNDGWRFLTLGRLTERTMIATRLIEVYFARLVGVGDRPSVRHWSNLLRAAGALQEYRRVFHTSLDPMDAIGFLVQDVDFPRSVLWGIARCEQHVGMMAIENDDRDNAAYKMIRELRASLEQPLEDLLGSEPSVALRDVASLIEAFSDQVRLDFFGTTRGS